MNDDGRTVAAATCWCLPLGMWRQPAEERLEVLAGRIEMGMDPRTIGEYLELRKYGAASTPVSGWVSSA